MGTETGTEYMAKTSYQGKSAESYDTVRTSSVYKRLQWEGEFRALEKILRWLPSSGSVLDAPTGTGRFLPLLDAMNFRFLAGDISPDMVNESIRKYQFNRLSNGYAYLDAEVLPFKDGSFDYVLSMRLFQHLPESVAWTILGEFRRVCNRGIILEVPLIQPFSPIIMKLRSVYHLGNGRRQPTLVNGKRQNYFPIGRDEFCSLLNSMNLRLTREHSITGFWGQMRVCYLEKIENA